MKSYNLLILFLLFSSLTQQQFAKEQIEIRQKLQLTITLEKDTFLLGDKITVNAQLLNKTNKTVIIPSNYTLTSNLYPNGVASDNEHSGGNFDFKISPVSKWKSIYIEDLAVQRATEFIYIKPDAVANFKIEIGEHINSFNKNFDNRADSLKINEGFNYHLKMIYSNKTTGDKKIFNGQVESNNVKIYLR
ncbi:MULTISPECIES: hypothetical protein [unclassified Arcicella]|uniref:hypothetical protein n=1 Tax=unclassified Arcicella TaxID=2644986 RepID=UPI00285AFC8C|nr:MULTISPECIES: hypothetical protein [unclassified Arcicella]MDR6562864.1 hypothetical protein [Arcicella sp. BE51]MDR6812795.1 hypothetical protein [Arcicella sp. BE140]MDR6824107.1 hypothetical protein [Arcicella sp. BE139]